MGGGPSWWITGTVIDSDYANTKRKWDCLFEFFPEKREQYSILRISLTDGESAWEQVFSKDELGAKCGGVLKSGGDFVTYFQKVLEDSNENLLKIACDHLKNDVTINLLDRKQNMKLKLYLNEKIPMSSFLKRIMKYLTYVEAEFIQENEKLENSEREKVNLKKQVDDAVNAKKEDDARCLSGLEILMEEKRQHWTNQSS